MINPFPGLATLLEVLSQSIANSQLTGRLRAVTVGTVGAGGQVAEIMEGTGAMGVSKFAGAVKHPVWISIGTLVGVLAIVIAFLQMGGGAKSGGLEVADMTFGNPTPIDAMAGAEGMEQGQVAGAATPLDIALKNTGGAVVHITRIETEVSEVKIVDCSMQGGGTTISASYGVKVPVTGYTAGQLVSSDALAADPIVVSTPVDYTIKPGSVDRMEVTVGPEKNFNGDPVAVAVQMRLVPDQGEPIQLASIALSQPALVEAWIPRQSHFTGSMYESCWKNTADFLDRVFDETDFQSPDLVRLRDTVQTMAS